MLHIAKNVQTHLKNIDELRTKRKHEITNSWTSKWEKAADTNFKFIIQNYSLDKQVDYSNIVYTVYKK